MKIYKHGSLININKISDLDLKYKYQILKYKEKWFVNFMVKNYIKCILRLL
jgi:hypothetical protein